MLDLNPSHLSKILNFAFIILLDYIKKCACFASAIMDTQSAVQQYILDHKHECKLHTEEISMTTTKSKCKMYDLDNPPEAEEQFDMFPVRDDGYENLAYILMKMEGRPGYLPIVFCADCAREKYFQYCHNGVWEYQYGPCGEDED